MMEKEVLNTSMMIQVINVNPNCGQGCAKTRVFHQKPNPVGLTGLNRVLMGFMG